MSPRARVRVGGSADEAPGADPEAGRRKICAATVTKTTKLAPSMSGAAPIGDSGLAGEADVHETQLTIAGIPTAGCGPTTGTSESFRAGSRSLTTLQDAASVPRRHGATSVGAPVGRPAEPQSLSARDVYDLGVRTDLVTACRIALGVGATTAYALAGRGELPFPAYRVGRQWVVPTAGLLAFLGLPPREPNEPVAPDKASGAQG
jgi:hypothetical protein